MTRGLLVVAALAAFSSMPALSQEADHEIHEQLRAMLREVESAMNSGQFDRMLPVLDEQVEATSITQEVMGGRSGVSNYFKQWFGPSGYMKSMSIKFTPDALTELSPDKSWGLVRGSAAEHYDAKDGDQFDFKTRWTAVVTRGADDRWRLRAIHFGTNHLDNPVLTKVQRTLTHYGVIAAGLALVVGLLIGVWLGRRSARAPARGAA
jgi:ketosteroid isomerase-like protein